MGHPSYRSRRNRQPWLLFAVVALLIETGCATATDPATRERIWQETVVDVMGRPPTDVRRLADLATLAEPATPAVVYLHGCGGRGNTAHSHIRFFKLQGFAVFAPEHHTRADAISQCDQDTARTWQKPGTRTKRVEEATLVRDRLRQLPWIDQQRVYLAGHSEGGWAVAAYPYEGDFAGIIVIGASCGDRLESHTPVLTIAARHDQFAINSNAITCATYRQANATHLVVEGGDHNFIIDAEPMPPSARQARDAILGFLAGSPAGR
jgi:dienelactone hydrolase